MDLEFSPSDFVAVFNQTLEYVYPRVTIVGELANFKISKNKWLYFDLKDDHASVKFFGTIYSLPGPLEDGLVIKVTGQPRMSPKYGFSITAQSIVPVGEGSLNKAAKLLESKLSKEGLFDNDRKRSLPFPPKKIGLIASKESAAFADFVKVLKARWSFLEITHVDVQVQGDQAVTDIVRSVDYLNQSSTPPDVIVLTRGGGSADDLATFNNEQVTRSVAASRVPTLVAIGHETDVSLAELAADKRASTPSNAAEILVPDRLEQAKILNIKLSQLSERLEACLQSAKKQVQVDSNQMTQSITALIEDHKQGLSHKSQLLAVLDPAAALSRGYAVVRKDGRAVTNSKDLSSSDKLNLMFHKGSADVSVDKVN